jgi:protein disulfide-isomerase
MRATHLAIVVVLLFTSAVRAGEGLQWHFDLESAKRAAVQTNRPILVHFWSPSCAPCVKLEQEVYSRPEVKRALEAMFVLARLNVDDYPATASNFGVKSWPADVILAPDGQFVSLLRCPLVADQYLAQLGQFGQFGQFGRGATQVAEGGPLRPDLPHQAATNMPNRAAAANSMGPAPANSVLQTSAVATTGQANAPTRAPATGPYHWGGSAGRADLIERYDFRSAHNVDTSPPQTQLTRQQPSGNFGGQQHATPQYQPTTAQNHNMVPALAAPPVGLGGLCPVQVHRVRQFNNNQARYKATKGDPRYGVVHRGRTYLFTGPSEQQEFLLDPDRYSPVLSGADPVVYFDEGRKVDGDWSFGRFIGERVYLFASQQTLEKFLAENEASRSLSRPNRYAEAIYQAENPGRGMMR